MSVDLTSFSLGDIIFPMISIICSLARRNRGTISVNVEDFFHFGKGVSIRINSNNTKVNWVDSHREFSNVIDLPVLVDMIVHHMAETNFLTSSSSSSTLSSYSLPPSLLEILSSLTLDDVYVFFHVLLNPSYVVEERMNYLSCFTANSLFLEEKTVLFVNNWLEMIQKMVKDAGKQGRVELGRKGKDERKSKNVCLNIEEIPGSIFALILFMTVKEIKLRELKNKENEIKTSKNEPQKVNNSSPDPASSNTSSSPSSSENAAAAVQNEAKLSTSQRNLEIVSAFSPDLTNLLENEELCPICYSYPIDAVYYPCMHEACHRCLIRNIQQGSRMCFMCKTKVDSWEMKNVKQKEEEINPFGE
jgi:hypothetical protein